MVWYTVLYSTVLHYTGIRYSTRIRHKLVFRLPRRKSQHKINNKQYDNKLVTRTITTNNIKIIDTISKHNKQTEKLPAAPEDERQVRDRATGHSQATGFRAILDALVERVRWSFSEL